MNSLVRFFIIFPLLLQPCVRCSAYRSASTLSKEKKEKLKDGPGLGDFVDGDEVNISLQYSGDLKLQKGTK